LCEHFQIDINKNIDSLELIDEALASMTGRDYLHFVNGAQVAQ
jgi:hypothetical protein